MGWLGLTGLGCCGALTGLACGGVAEPVAAAASRGLVVTEIDQAEVVNRRPRFLAPAPLMAKEGRAYRYGATAVDPDGDELSYSLVQAPQGARLQGRTVTWVPGHDQVGHPQDFTLRAADPHGLVRDQVWQVIPGSRSAPRFVSKAPHAWDGAGSYHYHVRLDAGPGRRGLRLALEKAPAGTSLRGAGRDWNLVWAPPQGRAEPGSRLFILRAIDARGGVAIQIWAVDVLG